MGIKKTSRKAMLEKLGLLKIVDPLTTEAYDLEEYELWKDSLNRAPHGELWHTSFHASSFPGNRPKACPRKALYEMMGTPQPGPVNRVGRGYMDAGKAIELELVRRWAKAGRIISADQTGDDEYQSGFAEEDIWFTGALDAIMLPVGWHRLLPVEVKGKKDENVVRMKRGERGPDSDHVAQLKAYIGEAHDTLHLKFPKLLVCKTTWAVATGLTDGECRRHNTDDCLIEIDIQPTQDGALYYVSMDSPGLNTHEFRIDYDKEFMDTGRERLKEWKDNFERGILPQTQEKKHPFGWGWSELPCKYCPFKKHACKPDWKDGVTKLEDSNAIEFSKTVIDDYVYDDVRQRVLDRWNGEDKS